jgi:hypothetical protein
MASPNPNQTAPETPDWGASAAGKSPKFFSLGSSLVAESAVPAIDIGLANIYEQDTTAPAGEVDADTVARMFDEVLHPSREQRAIALTALLSALWTSIPQRLSSADGTAAEGQEDLDPGPLIAANLGTVIRWSRTSPFAGETHAPVRVRSVSAWQAKGAGTGWLCLFARGQISAMPSSTS